MNPETDKIASAALDGEATAEELARLADDPGFVAAKAQFESVSAFLTQEELPAAPDGLAQTQISAAMDQFRADAAQRALLAAQPSTKAPTQVGSNRASSKWSMPTWLVPALFSVAVLGGLGFVASNLTGDSATTEAADAGSDSALMAETTEAMDSDDSMEEEAATESPRAATTSAAAEMEEADAADDTNDAATTTTREASPLLTPDPIDLKGATFQAFKTASPEQIARLATSEPPLDPEEYDRCGLEHGYEPPDGAQKLVSVVPFTLDTEPAEVLVYETNDAEVKITQILSESCKVLDQS